MANIQGQARRSVGGLQWYLTNNEKKRAAGREYVSISGVNGAAAATFFEQMARNHAHHGKDGYVPVFTKVDGRAVPVLDRRGEALMQPKFLQYFSLVQGFGLDELDPNNPADWDRAHELGRALLQAPEFADHPGLVVTEIGARGKIHNHLILDAVNARTGRQLPTSRITHHRLAKVHDRVLAEQGFTQREDMLAIAAEVEARQRAGEKGWTYRRVAEQSRTQPRDVAAQQTLRHQAWEVDAAVAQHEGTLPPPEPFAVEVLEQRARAALKDPRSVSWEALAEVADEHDIVIEPRGKDVTYGMRRRQSDGSLSDPAPSDRRRGSTLGGDLGRAEVEATLTAHREALEEAERQAELQARRLARQVAVAEAAETATASSESSEFRSRLRGHTIRSKGGSEIQEVFAKFEEDAMARLGRGERLDESEVRRLGIGSPAFLARFGEALQPQVFEQLELRAVKVAAVGALRDERAPLVERWQALKTAGERHDPTGWYFGREADDLRRGLELNQRRREKLTDELVAGVYEEVRLDVAKQVRAQRARADEIELRGAQDERDQQLGA